MYRSSLTIFFSKSLTSRSALRLPRECAASRSDFSTSSLSGSSIVCVLRSEMPRFEQNTTSVPSVTPNNAAILRLSRERCCNDRHRVSTVSLATVVTSVTGV